MSTSDACGKPRKRPPPWPGSTITTGGHIQETKTDHVNPDIAGGPDHGTPHPTTRP